MLETTTVHKRTVTSSKSQESSVPSTRPDRVSSSSSSSTSSISSSAAHLCRRRHVRFNMIPTSISVAPSLEYDDDVAADGATLQAAPVVSESSWAHLRRMLLAELSAATRTDSSALQPHFAALRTVSIVTAHSAELMVALLAAEEDEVAAEVLESVLEALFRFISLHTQDDTLAASRRIVADGVLADAVHCAAVAVGARRSLPAVLSWFVRQATVGSLSSPDIACGLIRAARRSAPPSNSSDIVLNVITHLDTEAKLAAAADRSSSKRQRHRQYQQQHSKQRQKSRTTASAIVFTSAANSFVLSTSSVDAKHRDEAQSSIPSAAAAAAASSIVLGRNPGEEASVASLRHHKQSAAAAAAAAASPSSISSSVDGCVFVQVGEGSSPNLSTALLGCAADDAKAMTKKQKRRFMLQRPHVTATLQIAHEVALSEHYRRTKELSSWMFLLLHNAVFHPKMGGTGGASGVGDLMDAALAFASALCPKARRQAGEAPSMTSFTTTTSVPSSSSSSSSSSYSSTSSSNLPVEARAMLTSGLVIALAWARMRGATGDDSDIVFFTRHFHGLAANVDAAVDELYRRCSGNSIAEWLSSSLMNTWPAVSRWLGACDIAPDGGVSEFLAGRVPRAGLPSLELVGCFCEH